MNYYEYSSSLAVLEAQIKRNSEVRGYKALLADAAACQRSYLSQVLSGMHFLNAEQMLGLAAFWNASAAERDFLLDLVGAERAGTVALREFYKQRVKDARAKSTSLTDRFQVDILPTDAMTTYYSHWLHAAIHMALTVTGLQTIASLSRRFRLPQDSVNNVLQQLIDFGLVEKKSERFLAKNAVVHLPKKSPLNQFNHSNWRQYAVHKAIQSNPEDLHYTAIYSLSKEDVKKLQAMILSFIEDTRRVVAPSKEEEVIALLIDYFVV